jgi:hypothetical protein
MYPIKKRLFSIKKHYRASFNAALGKTNPKNRQGPRRLPEHQKELGSNNWDLTPIYDPNLFVLCDYSLFSDTQMDNRRLVTPKDCTDTENIEITAC